MIELNDRSQPMSGRPMSIRGAGGDRAGRTFAALLVSGALLAFSAAPTLAQAPAAPGAPAAPAKPPIPPSPARTPDGHPNWTGFWVLPNGMLEVDYGPSGVTGRPPGVNNVPQPQQGDGGLKSPYKERFQATQQALAKGELPDQSALCIPNGMPRMMGMIYGMELLQTPNIIAITSDYQGTTRRIWTSLKSHPPADELEDTYAGHSIGHWEGDTLVVDTVGVREDVPMDGARRPHSPKMRIIERFSSAVPGMLVDDITIEDPDALVAPIKQTRTYRYRPDLMLREYSCADNNRNVDLETGKPVFK